MKAVLISAQAHLGAAQVKPHGGGRSHNAHRTRQAIRGLRDMFRKDGLIR